MLCVCVMSQVPGTSRNTMMNFTCGRLGNLGSLREGGKGSSQGYREGGSLPPALYTHHLSLDFLLSS